MKKFFQIIVLILICSCAVSLKAQLRSTILEQNIPATLNRGQVYTMTVTMKNTGNEMWYTNDNLYLTLYQELDNAYESDVWGIKTIPLPYSVSPNDKVSFLFNITAPLTAGTYNCKWSMAKNNEFFGEATPSILVNVGGEDVSTKFIESDYNSEIIEQIIPSEMVPGQTYKILLTLRNNGKMAWSSSTGNYMISNINDVSSGSSYPNWNPSPIYIVNAIEPGQTGTVEFYVTAPTQPGKYDLQWMLKRGENYFGQKTKSVSINVLGNNTVIDNSVSYNSSFIEQKIPEVMNINQEYEVSVTMANTGNKTWIKNNEHLVIVDSKMLPVSMNAWNVGYVNLPYDVEPGKVVDITFRVKPQQAGWQSLSLGMMTNQGKVFGNSSKQLEILVNK